MKNKPTIRNLLIFVIILIIFSSLYIILDKVIKKESIENTIFLKNYEVNEYIPMYISDEDMAKIYLNDYVHIMYSDIEKAYNLLDEEYKAKKFGSMTNYQTYINSLTYSSYKLDRYYVETKDEYKIFGVYDTNGNLFIFKTRGVMQYTVYLDNYTVEI